MHSSEERQETRLIAEMQLEVLKLEREISAARLRLAIAAATRPAQLEAGGCALGATFVTKPARPEVQSKFSLHVFATCRR